jgi:glucan phosphoethanolaminetransferase (alkaline phosphatase superfamily)
MHESIFRLWVLTLGLTLLGTLIYGLSAFPPQTITQTMIDSTVFRLVLTVCVLLQIVIWFLCLWSKRHMDPEISNWAFVSHIVFVCIAVTCLLIFLLIIMQMTSDRESLCVLHFSLLILVISIVAMIVLYNNQEFFIAEYIAFITYSIIFTAFFATHTNVKWLDDDDESPTSTRHLNWDDGEEIPGEICIPLTYPDNQRGTYHVGGGSALWVPQRI